MKPRRPKKFANTDKSNPQTVQDARNETAGVVDDDGDVKGDPNGQSRKGGRHFRRWRGRQDNKDKEK
jgi:hypothetical protein